MLRLNWRLGACALGLAALALSPAFSAPDDDVTGDWKLDGSDGKGHYAGNVAVSQNSDQSYSAVMTYKYDDGNAGGANWNGTRTGKWFKGQRTRTVGVNGVLAGVTAKPQNEWFALSSDGLKLAGTYADTHENFSRDSKPAPAKATITADKQIVLVPGAPSTIKGAVHVEVTAGKVRLEVLPAGALKVNAPDALDVGSYDFTAEPAAAGTAEIRLLSGSSVVASVKTEVVKEQLYLVLFGYMGPEVTYEDGDMGTSKSNVLPKLQAAGYTVIEDGKGFSQSTIDQKLNDPKSGAKKVVVDWCTSTADWNAYFDRGSVKGYLWSSHGFMEPYPGCPDSELKSFESRQWTCAVGDPSNLGDKHFIREWKGKLEKNSVSTLDFSLNHACCTGGIGDYASEAWQYCSGDTLTRVKAIFGANTLPAVSDLTFTTHDSLKGHFNFQQNFNGSAYFGMSDVRWDELVAAIKP